jgi:hypothetical protein
MNLLCPNCQKMLQVPEQYAGQLMKCPLCAGTFTVPALPQPPAAPPPLSAPVPPPPPTPAAIKDNVPAAPSPSAEPSAGYTHTRSCMFNPQKLVWVAPLALVLVFFLMFFSWIGMYPWGTSALTQSGWGAVVGSTSVDDTWKTLLTPEESKAFENAGASPFVILFILLFFPTLLITVGAGLVQLKLVPVQLPPALETFWPWRPFVVAGLTLVTFLFLLFQAASDFPVESAAKTVADQKVKDRTADLATRKQEYINMAKGLEYGRYNLERTTAFALILWLLLLAIVAALLEGWVARRGNQPLPRIDLQY